MQSRAWLAEVIRNTAGTITPDQVAAALRVSNNKAARLLSQWAMQGWVSRVRRGLYVPVPLESRTTDVPLEDSWLVAERLYSPCYVGGWSAAEYWRLTEQVFRTLLVFTVRKPRNRAPVFKGASFQLRTVSARAMFGLKSVWRGQVRVDVSDPSRTLVDVLADPATGGGLRSAVDMLRAYLESKEFRNLAVLVEHAKHSGNGAVFKRLGFLLERYAPEEQEAIRACRAQLSKGNARLDPGLPASRLVSAWRLWLPESWDGRAMARHRVEQPMLMAAEPAAPAYAVRRPVHLDVSRVLRRLGTSEVELAAFCRKHGLKKLAFFGSVTRDDFRSDSDVDVKVEFEPGRVPGLEIVDLRDNLSRLFSGRPVDLLTSPVIRNPYRRRSIERDLLVAYAA